LFSAPFFRRAIKNPLPPAQPRALQRRSSAGSSDFPRLKKFLNRALEDSALDKVPLSAPGKMGAVLPL
jgi:hypothetical protein